ncbi:hypothetical protein JCM11641_006060 [Rhodosporidiobolus odoratus]
MRPSHRQLVPQLRLRPLLVSPLSTAYPRSRFDGDRVQRNSDRLQAVSRDFRTDTITVPTDEMLELMKGASRGDDVYGEDEDTLEFQERIAKLAGKEAALFCASGTMTNQLAIRAHLHQPPYSVVTDSRAHVHLNEAGGIAFHSSATTYPVMPENGHYMAVEEVLGACVIGDDVHGAPTRLVCVENTLNGMIYPQAELNSIASALSPLDIPLHCDGARLWEVLAKTGISLEEACRPFETVSLCMSKGLGAPVGSVLVGPKQFIKKATHFRKLFGGGWRQSGPLALAASHALSTTLPQLSRTHTLATRLATALVDEGITLELPVETNQVWMDTRSAGFSIPELAQRVWEEQHIRLNGGGWGRIVLHSQISQEAVEGLIEVVRGLARERGRERAEWERGVGEEGVEGSRENSRALARGEWEGGWVGKGTKTQGYGKGGKR